MTTASGKAWSVLGHRDIIARVIDAGMFAALDGNFRRIPEGWTLMRIAIADRAHQCHTMAWFVLQGKADPQAITCALVGLDTYITNELKHQSKVDYMQFPGSSMEVLTCAKESAVGTRSFRDKPASEW